MALECPICLDDSTTLPKRACPQCCKLFHCECLNLWFFTLKRQGLKLSCPTCRYEILNVKTTRKPDIRSKTINDILRRMLELKATHEFADLDLEFVGSIRSKHPTVAEIRACREALHRAITNDAYARGR